MDDSDDGAPIKEDVKELLEALQFLKSSSELHPHKNISLGLDDSNESSAISGKTLV